MKSSKTVSNHFTRFKSVSDEKLHELKRQQLKKRTYAKMMWGVNAYKLWRKDCLSNPCNFDVRIWESDLDNVDGLNVEVFKFALCKFIAEVTKAKDGSEYPGKTLYHLVISIQKYLNEKGKDWKLVESRQFVEVRNVLDNVMKERASRNIGTSVKQAKYISLNFEEELWKKGLLGEDSPDKLRGTVLFLIGMNMGLRAGDEHHALRRNTPDTESQIQFKCDSKGVRCVVYKEDSVTKCNDGGIKHMRKQRKIVWVHPSDDKARDPVRLIEKYINLCPVVTEKSKKFNFYLRSLEKPTPSRWYGEQPVSINTLRSVVKNMIKDGNLPGFKTNHSLRRSGTTRLFQNGIDRKLIKEFTGHVLDAVDNYAVTSDEQRAEMSKIIHGEKAVEKVLKEPQANVQFSVCEQLKNKSIGCCCSNQKINVTDMCKIGDMIEKLVTARKGEKATIKIELQFGE